MEPIGVHARVEPGRFATDADATNNAITYSLDDNAGGRFAIHATSGVVTVADGTKLSNGRIFSDLKFKDTQARSDGIRSDIDGNIWASASGGPGIDVDEGGQAAARDVVHQDIVARGGFHSGQHQRVVGDRLAGDLDPVVAAAREPGDRRLDRLCAHPVVHGQLEGHWLSPLLLGA